MSEHSQPRAVRGPEQRAPEYELLSREGAAEPFGIYQRIREQAPVYWSRVMHCWLIMGYEEVTQSFRHPLLSSRRVEQTLEVQLQHLAPSSKKDVLRLSKKLITMKDVPEHIFTRKWTGRGFGPHLLATWRPLVQRVVDEVLEKVRGREGMDVVKDFAEPIPAQVMAGLFGVSPSDQEHFHQCAERVAAFFGGASRALEQAVPVANKAIGELELYFQQRIAEQRSRPEDNLLGLWLAGHEGQELDVEDVVAQCIAAIVGGNITTADQIAIGVDVLLRHPEQLRKLREQPELFKPAMEELLRFDSSVPFMHRVVQDDFELGGQRLKKGQMVFLGLTAANHDPTVYEEPERFDVTRKPGQHLGYGTGRHVCLGIHLARVELELGLGTLFTRMPDLRLDSARPARPRFNWVTRGYESLPVRF